MADNGRDSPRPMYRFEMINKKIKEDNKLHKNLTQT
jgi:hypothetical protein